MRGRARTLVGANNSWGGWRSVERVSDSVSLLWLAAVYCWGEGLNGQLGVGGAEAMTYPCEVHGVAARAIACGPFHTAAVTTDGRVITWGYNKDGQLGHGDTESKLAPVEVLGLRATGA